MRVIEIFEDNNYKFFLKELEDLKKEGEDFQHFENYLYDLKTAQELLNNMLYFIMIQGRLKTGKSTLINILSDKKVSITKIDNDTTKIPYIITLSESKTSIVKYEKIGSIPSNKYGSIFKAILNDIMGVKVEDVDIDENKYFIKKEESFNLDKLKKYTTTENNNILLLNIKVKPEHTDFNILKENIAIVDTPGIGGASYKKEKDLISYIREKIDMLILLQSTLTPFDEILLEELNTFSSDINLRLLHNSFELKSWASDEIRESLQKQENDLILKAKHQILDKSKKKDIPVFSFNFGKIEDYIVFESLKNKLKDEFEKYIDFKRNIVEYIKKNRRTDREITVKRNLKNILDKVESDLISLKQKYENEYNDLFEKQEDIVDSFEKYKETIYKGISNINFELGPFLLSISGEKIFKECFLDNQFLLNIKISWIYKIRYGFINKIIKNKKIKEISNFMRYFNECFNKKFLNYLNEKLNYYLELLYKDSFERLNNNVLWYKQQSLPKFYFEESDFNEFIFDLEDHYIFVEDKERVKENIKEYLDKEFKVKIQEYQNELKKILLNKYNNYFKNIDEIKNEIISSYEAKYKSQKNYYEKVLNSLYSLLDNLSLIKKKYNLL